LSGSKVKKDTDRSMAFGQETPSFILGLGKEKPKKIAQTWGGASQKGEKLHRSPSDRRNRQGVTITSDGKEGEKKETRCGEPMAAQ